MHTCTCHITCTCTCTCLHAHVHVHVPNPNHNPNPNPSPNPARQQAHLFRSPQSPIRTTCEAHPQADVPGPRCYLDVTPPPPPPPPPLTHYSPTTTTLPPPDPIPRTLAPTHPPGMEPLLFCGSGGAPPALTLLYIARSGPPSGLVQVHIWPPRSPPLSVLCSIFRIHCKSFLNVLHVCVQCYLYVLCFL